MWCTKVTHRVDLSNFCIRFNINICIFMSVVVIQQSKGLEHPAVAKRGTK